MGRAWTPRCLQLTTCVDEAAMQHEAYAYGSLRVSGMNGLCTAPYAVQLLKQRRHPRKKLPSSAMVYEICGGLKRGAR
jgi:hypothetical protein